MRRVGVGQGMKCEQGLAGWEHWGMTHALTGKHKPCRDAGGDGDGERRRGFHGQSCAEVAWEAECVQGRGMLRVPLLLLKSLRSGGMRY